MSPGLRLFCAIAVLGVTIASADPKLLAQALERALYVTVVDETAQPVEGLQATDFIVREDGVQREVLRATPATEPLQIAIAVDNSQAATDDIPHLREGLHAFVQGLPDDTDISLVTIGDRPTIVVDYTRDRRQVDSGIDRIFARPGSGAYALEALMEMSKGIQKRESPRPVIVLITTEGPEFSEMHQDYVLNALEQSGAAFHAVVLTDPGADLLSDPARTRAIVLDRGTQAGGGRHDLLLTSQALTDTLRTLAAEISHQYRVVYARPQTLIPPRKIEVGVTKSNLKARGTPVHLPATQK